VEPVVELLKKRKSEDELILTDEGDRRLCVWNLYE
jgi:hypothetical protein